MKIALVTGASRGIGLAVAEAFQATETMHVVRLARSLQDRAAERRTDIACDVTDPASDGRRIAANSPRPIEMYARTAQYVSQSVQPTAKPIVLPNARRAYT